MKNLLENLNKEQQEAVTHATGPLLIVAGAGTGKTTVITRRIAYLIEQKLAKPEEILALTFTEKAAEEMQERVDLLLPLGYYDMWVSTFHSFCERLLKNHALDIGLPNDFTLLDDVNQWILVYNNLDKFKLNYYRPLGNPAKFIDALLAHFSRCKDELITPGEYLDYAQSLRLKTDSVVRVQGTGYRAEKKTKRKVNASNSSAIQTAVLTPQPSPLNPSIDGTEIARLEEIADAYHVYQKLLLDNNFLDFGDLINYALELLKKRPKILEYYQAKFKFLMVDEFQDTNFAQYQLVKLLAGCSAPDSSGQQPADKSARYTSPQNLTVVGDDDQSIYKFRGASVSNILKFKEDYPKVKQITLVENYRSGQDILDLAYNFIQGNNPDRLEEKLKIDKRLKSNVPEQGTVKVLEGEDLSGELDLVAKKILELKTEGNSWNDFAILIRANSAANELLPVLSARGVPFTYVANRGLYKKPVILDLLSYLKLLDNCHDSHSLYRVLCLPKFRLTHQELSALTHASHKKALSLFEILENVAAIPAISAEAKKKIDSLVSIVKKHTTISRQINAAELAVLAIRDLGIEQVVLEDTPENAENRELLDQFYKKIEDFERNNADKSMHHFLYNLELEMQAGSDGVIKFDPNLGPESLKVMTIHSAKGLEFKYVFVINLVDQRFPTREKPEAIEIPKALIKDILPEGDFHLQEERRLFYVGLTRAKSQLYLSWAKDYGGARTKKPSLFLQETKLVPSDIVSKATGKVVFTQKPKKELVFHELPPQFSYSQLNDFENCPLKYKYQHYLKLPVPGSCYLSFGQTIHKVFEEYLNLYKNSLEIKQQDLFGGTQKGDLPDFKLLEQFYEKNWVDDWYRDKKQKEEYRVLGKRMLKTFYDTLKANPTQPKYIEKFFKLKIGQYDFVGKIDRADIVPGGIGIIDYKTGKVPKSKKDLDQLYIYQWAAQDFLREKVMNLRYWYLEENRFVEEETAKPEELEKLQAKLLELIERIVHTTKYDLFKEEHKKAKAHDCEFEGLE